MARKKLIVGENDVKTSNPQLANLFYLEEDKCKYTEFSSKKVEFKCDRCDSNVGLKRISDVNTYGLSCKYCKDGMSYPERFMTEILKQLNLDFEYNKQFKWSDKKRYDFYIKDMNLIIETHGKQHYNGAFVTMGGKDLKSEMLNDNIKRILALDNGIDSYIEVNCSESDFLYIKNSILNSELKNHLQLNDVNWEELNKNIENSNSLKCLNLWNNQIQDINEISKILNIKPHVVRRYIKIWSDIGRCNYNEGLSRKNLIIQTYKDGTSKTWTSVNEILESNLNYKRVELDKCLCGIIQEVYNCKFEYVNGIRNGSKAKKVAQYTIEGIKIEEYKSLKEINMKLGYLPSQISACCNEKIRTSYGYVWKYI